VTINLPGSIALVAATTLVATALPAQQSDIETSLRALRTVLAVTQKAPPKSQPPRMHFAYELDAEAGCGVKLTSRWKTGHVERRTVFEADLSALSPDVEIQRGTADSLVFVSANTSSGRPDILERVVRGAAANREERTDKLLFLLWEHALADSLAHHLAGAVRACGGQPRTEEAARLAGARRDSIAAMVKARELAPEVRAEAIEACHLAIRGKLRAPEGARFEQEPLVGRSEADSTVSVLGKLLDDSDGKRAGKRYTCTLAKRGERYVSLNAAVF
jgi:hypothetical protein